jgi:hypothetical protein
MLLLLLSQPGKLGIKRMIGREKRLLAMKDRRIRAFVEFEAIDFPSAQRQFDAADQSRMRFGLEFGIDEVRNFDCWAVQLDDLGA